MTAALARWEATVAYPHGGKLVITKWFPLAWRAAKCRACIDQTGTLPADYTLERMD